MCYESQTNDTAKTTSSTCRIRYGNAFSDENRTRMCKAYHKFIIRYTIIYYKDDYLAYGEALRTTIYAEVRDRA